MTLSFCCTMQSFGYKITSDSCKKKRRNLGLLVNEAIIDYIQILVFFNVSMSRLYHL